MASKFSFSVDSSLLSELGEKLVANVHVALTELVKNGYDADATSITVAIDPIPNSGPKVRIEDNGVGMNKDQVVKFWMKIGTHNKVDSPRSEVFGRHKTGAKGIGRFCCRKLGRKLKLTTCSKVVVHSRDKKVKETFYETTVILFDWNRFSPGTDVEDVELTGETTKAKTGKTGTILEIWDAPFDEWQQRGFDYAKRQLGVLAANTGEKREGYKIDPGFKITFNAPGLSGGVGDLRAQLLNATWGTLDAHVDETGRAVCNLKAKGLGPKPKTINSTPKFALLKGVKLLIGIMPMNAKDFRDKSVLSKQTASEIADQWGGIQVRFNGFRMYPYGNDDWLGIEEDRGRRLGKPTDEDLFNFATTLQHIDASRSLLNMLSMKNYLGYVETFSEIPGLEPRIDRQGFVENEVFRQLKDFVRFAVDWANIYRDFYIQSRVDEDAQIARQTVIGVLQKDVSPSEVVPEVASYLRKEIQSILRYVPEQQRSEKEKAIFGTLTALQTTGVSQQKELEHLRLIASASTLTLLFAHEIKTLLGRLSANAVMIDSLADDFSGERKKELKAVAQSMDETRTRFSNLIEMTGLLGAFDRDAKVEKIHLQDAVARAARCFELIKASYGIEIDFSTIPRDMMVGPMVEGELYAILLNILSNAIKSVIAAGGDPKITIKAKRSGSHVDLDFLDNGLGLSEDQFDEVFRPFLSDPEGQLYEKLEERANPEDRHLFGTGSGLGLSIVRDIARARKGNVVFLPPPSGWAAHVRVTLL
jgi:signal transduction histidine kinase